MARFIRRPAGRRTVRKIRHLSAASVQGLDLRRLIRNNSESRESVLGNAPVVVSLTTHGKRIETVYLAIESIARGTLKPERLILWLDDKTAYDALPSSLEKLRSRGLEIRLTDNFGPHTKYWPYIAESEAVNRVLVTADDDVIVPRYWLKQLHSVSQSSPDQIICFRAHVVGIDGDQQMTTYSSWEECWTKTPSLRNFGTGVSGIAYPVSFQNALRRKGIEFIEHAPRADDVWLHYVSVLNAIETRQVHSFALEFPLIPASQAGGLYHANVGSGENDRQIKATYGREQVLKIARSSPLNG